MLNISNTNDIKATSINCLIYGESGNGKTTLASTLKGKTLVVSAEGGLLSLKNKGVDYVDLEGDGERKVIHLKKIFNELIKSDYENLFFDSITELSQSFYAQAAIDYPDERQTLKRYGHTKEVITKFVKLLRDSKKNIFLTALVKTEKDDIGKRFSVPNLVGSSSVDVVAYMDFVFYLGVYPKEEQEVRALLTRPDNGFACKDRSGKLNKYEPANLQLVIDKVFKEK